MPESFHLEQHHKTSKQKLDIASQNKKAFDRTIDVSKQSTNSSATGPMLERVGSRHTICSMPIIEEEKGHLTDT